MQHRRCDSLVPAMLIPAGPQPLVMISAFLSQLAARRGDMGAGGLAAFPRRPPALNSGPRPPMSPRRASKHPAPALDDARGLPHANHPVGARRSRLLEGRAPSRLLPEALTAMRLPPLRRSRRAAKHGGSGAAHSHPTFTLLEPTPSQSDGWREGAGEAES